MRTCRALIGLPVFAPDSERRLGRISDVLLDHENGQAIGMVIDGGGWLNKARWLRAGDPPGNPTVEEHQVLTSTEAVPLSARDRELLERLNIQNRAFMERPVMDKDGRHLGYLDDVVIAEDGWIILGYQLGTGWMDDWLYGKRLLPYSAAVQMTEDGLIVSEPLVEE